MDTVHIYCMDPSPLSFLHTKESSNTSPYILSDTDLLVAFQTKKNITLLVYYTTNLLAPSFQIENDRRKKFTIITRLDKFLAIFL